MLSETLRNYFGTNKKKRGIGMEILKSIDVFYAGVQLFKSDYIAKGDTPLILIYEDLFAYLEKHVNNGCGTKM